MSTKVVTRPHSADLDNLETGLVSADTELQLEAARELRQLLSSDRDHLIHEILQRNWVPHLLSWLRLRDQPTLQIEALWALTNIAAGTSEHTHVLIKNGAVPTLVSLLDSTNDEVLEQSVWVLGNLAGESTAARDAVLNAGALVPLIRRMNENSKLSLLRIATWTLSNLCDGQPRPLFEINLVLPTLAKTLETTDTEVLSHVCWAFSHLCDGPSSHIQQVVSCDICWRLVELLMHRSWRVTKPALRAIGNIVCAEDDQDYTQHIIECGAVTCLRQLIGHSNREIQKEACWTLSNIAAGTVDQIQCVLDSGSIPPLVKLAAAQDTDAEVKSEASWVVLNATSCGSDSQIEYLVTQGCVAVLGELLADTSMVMMALEGLERILQVGEEESKRSEEGHPNANLMQITSQIEALESHKSTAIAKRATRIWKQHFVTCAICQQAYSKLSPETNFCSECKCFVCHACDCTVFHLSYQESFWNEVTEMEESEQKAKKNSKKKKNAKKRQKAKEKKLQEAKEKELEDSKKSSNSAPSSPTSKKGAKTGDGSLEDEERAQDDSAILMFPTSSSSSPSVVLSATTDDKEDNQTTNIKSSKSKKKKQAKKEKNNFNNAAEKPEDSGSGNNGVAAPSTGNRRIRKGSRSRATEDVSSILGPASGSSTPNFDLLKRRRAPTHGTIAAARPPRALTVTADAPAAENSAAADTKGENMVDFLQQTGSILALAERLDEEPEDDEELEDLAAIMQELEAMKLKQAQKEEN